MAQSAEEIYRSANGDRWALICDMDSGHLSVRHEANLASGGRVTYTEVEEFLSVAGSGPDFTALRHLLGRPTGPGTAAAIAATCDVSVLLAPVSAILLRPDR